MVMKERLELLDQEGMAKSMLYPTIGLLWEAELFDAELSARILPRLQSMDRGFLPRLRRTPDPDRASLARRPAEAARELERAVKDGCKGAFVAPFTITRKPHGESAITTPSSPQRRNSMCRSRFIRPSSPPASAYIIATTISRWAAWYYDLFAGQGVQHAFGTFFQFGVFDRFPKLRVVVLESQAGWIGYFLDRGDAIFNGTTLGATVRFKEKPSYYFKRQCYISADPDERTIAAMMQIVGEDKFFWATDYPHPDHPGNYLEELKGHDRADEGVGTPRHPRRERRARIPAHVNRSLAAL